MSDLKTRSPLLNALLSAGKEIIEADVKERIEEVKHTPMGHMIQAALDKKAEVEAQGRPANEQDVHDWLDVCRQIARRSE